MNFYVDDNAGYCCWCTSYMPDEIVHQHTCTQLHDHQHSYTYIYTMCNKELIIFAFNRMLKLW